MSKKLKGWKELAPGAIIEEAGNAVEFKTGDWRTQKPIYHPDRCKHCLFCWLYCPDSCIIVEDGKVKGIDYDHCKGCGVCAKVCPPKFNAIEMVMEEI